MPNPRVPATPNHACESHRFSTRPPWPLVADISTAVQRPHGSPLRGPTRQGPSMQFVASAYTLPPERGVAVTAEREVQAPYGAG